MKRRQPKHTVHCTCNIQIQWSIITSKEWYFELLISAYFLYFQMVIQLVNNGANAIWEHNYASPSLEHGQNRGGIRKPNPKDTVQ